MSENGSPMLRSTAHRTEQDTNPLFSADPEDGFGSGELPDFDNAHDDLFDADLSNIRYEEDIQDHEDIIPTAH